MYAVRTVSLNEKKYSTVYMYHNFIHSSVNGYLGCFYVLAIVNSSAKNIGIHVSFSIMVSSGYLPTCTKIKMIQRRLAWPLHRDLTSHTHGVVLLMQKQSDAGPLWLPTGT